MAAVDSLPADPQSQCCTSDPTVLGASLAGVAGYKALCDQARADHCLVLSAIQCMFRQGFVWVEWKRRCFRRN